MIPGVRRTIQGLKIGTNNVPVVFASGNVAATGTNQATGGSLIYPVNNVTDGNGTKTVVLPAIRKAGQVCYVYHSVATVGLPVYPASGAAINGGSANAAVTIEGKTLGIFIATSATNWAGIYTANT